MANDTIIVNFAALDEAIARFQSCNTVIGDSVSRIQANAARVGAAIRSGASETYQQKLRTLAGNFSKAQEELQSRIHILARECEAARTAESTAQTIAGNVESNFLL